MWEGDASFLCMQAQNPKLHMQLISGSCKLTYIAICFWRMHMGMGLRVNLVPLSLSLINLESVMRASSLGLF